jgi:hypothetical protein
MAPRRRSARQLKNKKTGAIAFVAPSFLAASAGRFRLRDGMLLRESDLRFLSD